MDNQIICPYCKKSIPLTEALIHQFKGRYESEVRKKLEEENKISLNRTRKELQLKMEDKINELKELKEDNRALQKQFLEMNSLIRQLKREKENVRVEMEKKLSQDEEKIRQETRKKVLEEHELKEREKDKKLQDALKKVEELKIKMEQGSQQTQGEVLELELEELLKVSFPSDNISEVKKGQRGADIKQEVIDKRGKDCGTILWELKNAKWSSTWIPKLKEDQRQAKAHLAVLVVARPPENLKGFSFKKGVWITTRKLVVPLALALRFDLIRINYERVVNVGKNEKMEILYQYITSVEFKQRIEAIVESFTSLQEEIEKEKRSYQAKWTRQEKQLRRVIDHTFGMYGDLQSVIGKSLPEIKGLNLLPSENSKKEQSLF